MTTITTTVIHCPSCGRYLTEAEELRNQRLRCANCKLRPLINLTKGVLTVQVIYDTG